MPFQARKLDFALGRPAKAEVESADTQDSDNGEGLPTPHVMASTAIRMAGIKEASQAMATLPGPRESVHFVATHRLDLSDGLNHLLERLGSCERLCIATLNFNERNLQAMLAWLDSGAVRSLSLAASKFFRAHKRRLYEECLVAFRERKQRLCACHSHAKVCTLAFASGERLSIEGSANMSGNGSGREQFCLINDAGLHDWHAAWITDLVNRHEGREEA